MLSHLLHRHAAASLYLASLIAALLSAGSLVANAKEPGGGPCISASQTPCARSALNCARNCE